MNHSCMPQALEELKLHCERWSVVELLVPEHYAQAFNDVRGRLPCLTQLCLNLYESVDSFAEAPRLQRLHLISGDDLITVLLPWHQLTMLACEDFTDIECIELLRKCPSLTNCEFIGYECGVPSGLAILSRSPIVHQRLGSFKLCGRSPIDTLRLLNFPSLRDLDVEVDNNDGALLIPFLARSRCELESATLRSIHVEWFTRCFPFSTSLVTLKIRTFYTILNNEVLRRLAFDGTVLPNLQSLDMDLDLQDWSSSLDLMRDMILSRCLGVGAPRSVRLHTFKLVYQPDEDEESEDDTGLMELAAELKPLLDPRMVEFTIRSDSDLWY
ncbi:hypothetical protein C8R46DRAFT_321397 [Mycena filopes]|nr:hypothetical protein C8R46DRAFT_321397 [Mycena filopes]